MHSADVELWLLLHGQKLNVSHLWHEGFILREAFTHPPTEAELVVSIDGHEDRRRVYLPDGLRPGQRQARYVSSP